jgi:hypothetical protein
VNLDRTANASRTRAGLLALALMTLLGCAAAKEMLALRQVEFHLNGVSGARAAGVSLEGIESYSDLRPSDVARLSAAIARRDVPMELTVHLEGRNPESNTVTAKLVGMDWSCLLDDKELVSGRLTGPYSFPPGVARDVPILVRFNLADAVGGRSRELVDVALAIAARRPGSHEVSITLAPSVDTPLGPMRYPDPITLVLVSPAGR